MNSRTARLGALVAVVSVLFLACAGAPPRTVLFDTLVDPATYGEQALGSGARPILIVYEAYPEADPEVRKAGRIDVPSLLRHIDRLTGGSPPEWGLLDFEEPFMEWIERGPGDEKWALAMEQMIAAIRAVKRAYPRTKWSYYQLPYVRYWIDGKSWADAAPDSRQRAAARFVEQCAPVLRECDWICPSVYCLYDPERSPIERRAAVREAGRSWRRDQVRIAVEVAAGRPVIPIISPIWQPNGDALVGAPVPLDQLKQDVIEPMIQAGCSGFVLWTAFGYYIDCAIKDKVSNVPGFDRASLVRHYMDGQAPRDWADPEVGSRIRLRAGKVVSDAIRAIREVEASVAPRSPSQAPVSP
jgi:hypothetical protein